MCRLRLYHGRGTRLGLDIRRAPSDFRVASRRYAAGLACTRNSKRDGCQTISHDCGISLVTSRSALGLIISVGSDNTRLVAQRVWEANTE